jgi:hypothetical protein
LVGWGFGGFWRVEGLDMRICWGFDGFFFRVLDRYAVKDAKTYKGGRDSARVNACPSDSLREQRKEREFG